MSTDEYAHARIDALQREVAYALAEIRMMLVPGGESSFSEYLNIFKEADLHAQRYEEMRRVN